MDFMNIVQRVLQSAGQGIYPCLFHVVTGAYCPGCGGTRALRELLRGHVFMSFLYHPLVPYMAVTAPLLLVVWIYGLKKKKPLSEKLWKAVLYVGIIILTANFLTKNYMLLFAHRDILEVLDKFTGL